MTEHIVIRITPQDEGDGVAQIVDLDYSSKDGGVGFVQSAIILLASREVFTPINVALMLPVGGAEWGVANEVRGIVFPDGRLQISSGSPPYCCVLHTISLDSPINLGGLLIETSMMAE